MTSDQLAPMDRFAVDWVTRVQRRPWWFIAAVLLAVALAATGMPKLEFSNNYRVFFSSGNPELIAFEDFQATYTKSDNILFVVQPEDGGVFTPRIADAIEMLTAEAWQIPYASRVDSITNFQHTWADGDDLTVEDLIRGGAELSVDELESRQLIAMAEPLLKGALISHDADTTGVNVVLQFPQESLEELPASVAASRELAQRVRDEYPGTHVALAGVSMLNNAFDESGQQDAANLMPMMFGVLVLFMLFMLRSISGSLATLAVVAFSAMTALGLAGHLGIQLSPIAITGPIIIMTLAIADSIHILVTMLGAMREGTPKAEALRESLRINCLAVVVTSVTTIVGFLTLNFSDTPPFHDLGNITALGILSAFVYSMTFLPALLTVVPIRVKQNRGKRRESDWLERFGRWVVRNHRPVLVVTVLIAVGLIALVPQLDLNDQWVRYFDERVDYRQDADFAAEHLSGLYPVEFSVPAGEPEGISDPEYLRTLERFTVWLREQPEVRHVFSYADIIKRLNKNMHGDDPAYHRLPDERQLAAQYLLLYELSLPFGLDLNDRVSVDKSSTRVTATLGDMTTRETRSFLTRSEDWFKDHAEARFHAVPTGPAVMFSYISKRNIESMLIGNVIAVILIALIMVVALRSLGLGVMSLVPNSVPVLMTFGIWALLVGKVGMAAAMVSVSSLGIIVDDTVHFLSKYLRARRERGLDRPEAVIYAFKTVGKAIITTTVILTGGFLILALSTFRINFELGLLTAIAIVVALLADFLLLPALLLWGHRTEEKESVNHDPVPVQS